MKEKKFDKQKLLTTAVTAVLVLFFIGGFMIGLDRVQSMEGTFPPNDIKEGISPAPESIEEAVAYLNKVLKKAEESDVALSFDDYFSIDADSLITDGSDEFKATLLFAADNFEDHISTVEESENVLSSVSFGDDISDLIRIPQFESMMPDEFKCSYIYYSCPSCGETADEQYSNCELCGSQREYLKKYKNEYELELSFDVSAPGALSDAFEKNFAPRSDDEISALTADVLAGSVNVEKTEVTYKDLKIIFKVNRLTDEITSLRYVKSMDVKNTAVFVGEFESLGKKSVSFGISETHNFAFTWPSVSLDKETLVIEPKNSDNLLATLICEDPLAMNVTWTSSDESVATVDSEGYINATKKTGETVITASIDYLGKTYSDSCTVYIRVPVESMKMSKKSAQLAEGETITLSTKVSPSDATVQTVKWYSEDESIATVDENGLVTAVANGDVVIYALSDDGYFRSTCEVSVK